ncbi:MAG TPA: phosphopantetheine-binding protein [Terriglobia bacterium]|nr:phosphopantetheine-binding protein [Terriglobia bacterium]
MEREAVAAVVKKHLMEIVPDIKEADLDMARSMKDLGANSLDIVEVVSCAMRELKVKVPRSELSKLTNMDGLVDLLHTSIQNRP